MNNILFQLNQMEIYQKSFSKLINGLKILSQNKENQSTFSITLKNQEIIDCYIEEILNQQLIALNPPSIIQIIKQFKDYYFLPQDQLGKKSNQIVFSKNQKYLFKLVTRNDINKLNKMIQNYIQHIICHNKCNLVKFSRVFIVKTQHDGYQSQELFLLMESLKSSNQFRIFDIKGCVRNTKQNHFLGKDCKFQQSMELKLLKKSVSQIQRLKFIQEISKDINFLCEFGVMDYSLILSFGTKTSTDQKYRDFQLQSNKICRVGLIDYLQQYNTWKQIENRIKTLFKDNKQISSVEPQLYAKRMIEFLKKCLL